MRGGGEEAREVKIKRGVAVWSLVGGVVQLSWNVGLVVNPECIGGRHVRVVGHVPKQEALGQQVDMGIESWEDQDV